MVITNHILMSRLARKIKDKTLLSLIRRYLQSGIMTGGVVSARTEGTPQGGPLSPLLSNILLDELDQTPPAQNFVEAAYSAPS
ncbi:reverse transcriptase domain-containing protein [Marinospirillum sp.]|uniref:reverse transcriptase domain-containing protein n=1 Tax=Marinospirillum sp. TaxID=2183934 RepID=UPI0025C20125|nr:reverse transcriptase domain-containing protein [Marinospirillum sp.]